MKTIWLTVTLLAGSLVHAGDVGPAIIGYLETSDRVITIKAGVQPVYAVQSKDGKILAENVTREQLQARFPQLHRVIEGALADASLRLDAFPK